MLRLAHLDVSVDDAVGVAVPDRVHNLPKEDTSLHLTELPLLRDVFVELSPCHELHHYVDLPLPLNHVEDVDDVGVVQPHQDLNLVPHVA